MYDFKILKLRHLKIKLIVLFRLLSVLQYSTLLKSLTYNQTVMEVKYFMIQHKYIEKNKNNTLHVNNFYKFHPSKLSIHVNVSQLKA